MATCERCGATTGEDGRWNPARHLLETSIERDRAVNEAATLRAQVRAFKSKIPGQAHFIERSLGILNEWYDRWHTLWKKTDPNMFRTQEERTHFLRENDLKALGLWHAMRELREFWKEEGVWEGNPCDPNDLGKGVETEAPQTAEIAALKLKVEELEAERKRLVGLCCAVEEAAKDIGERNLKYIAERDALQKENDRLLGPRAAADLKEERCRSDTLIARQAAQIDTLRKDMELKDKALVALVQEGEPCERFMASAAPGGLQRNMKFVLAEVRKLWPEIFRPKEGA